VAVLRFDSSLTLATDTPGSRPSGEGKFDTGPQRRVGVSSKGHIGPSRNWPPPSKSQSGFHTINWTTSSGSNSLTNHHLISADQFFSQSGRQARHSKITFTAKHRQTTTFSGLLVPLENCANA
jgi:hypothetical protein